MTCSVLYMNVCIVGCLHSCSLHHGQSLESANMCAGSHHQYTDFCGHPDLVCCGESFMLQREGQKGDK